MWAGTILGHRAAVFSTTAPSSAAARVEGVHYARLDGDDPDTPAATSILLTTVGSGGPVAVANIYRQFVESRISFGESIAVTTGDSDAVMLGYSSSGATPAWLLQLSGDGAEEVQSLDQLDADHVVLSGTFDGNLELSASVSLSTTSPAGFVAAYRVR